MKQSQIELKEKSKASFHKVSFVLFLQKEGSTATNSNVL